MLGDLSLRRPPLRHAQHPLGPVDLAFAHRQESQRHAGPENRSSKVGCGSLPLRGRQFLLTFSARRKRVSANGCSVHSLLRASEVRPGVA
jgi:hypothetical protein